MRVEGTARAAIVYRFRVELRAGWRSVLASVLIVGIAAGASLAAFAAARRTSTVFQRFVEATRAEDILIAPLTPAGTMALNSDRIAALPGVVTVAGAYGFAAFNRDGTPLDTSTVVVTDAAFSDTISVPLVREGRLPDPTNPDEVFASPAALTDLGIRVGGTLSLVIWPEARADVIEKLQTDENLVKLQRGELGQQRTFTVVGVGLTTATVARPDRTSLVFTKALYDQTHAGPVYAGWLVRLEPGTNLSQFEQAAGRLVPGKQMSFQTLAATRAATGRILRPQVLAWLVFGIVMAIAGLALWAQAAALRTHSLTDDDRVLETLGMTSRDLLLVAMLRTVMVAAASTSVAVAVALITSMRMPIGEAFRIEPQRGLDFDVRVLPIGAVATMVCTMAIGTILSRRRIAAGEHRREISAISRTVRRMVHWPSTTTGISNALDPQRIGAAAPVRSTLVGATAGIVVVTLVTTFALNLRTFVQDPSAFGWGYDATVDVGDVSEKEARKVLETLGTEFAVDDAVNGWATAEIRQSQINGRPEAIMGIGAEGGEQVEPTVTRGRVPEADDEVALGERSARSAHAAIGDLVTIGAQGNGQQFTVVGFVVLPGLPSNDEDPAALGGGALLTLPAFAEVFGLTDRQYKGSKVIVDLVAGASPTAFLARLTAAADAAGYGQNIRVSGPGLPPVQDAPIEPAEVTAYRHVVSTPVALAAILAALAAATVGVALVSAVRRRRREFGTLRALGFTRPQVLATVAWHASTVAAVAAVIGVPLGVIAGRETWLAVTRQIGIPERAPVPWTYVLVAPIVALAAANLVAALPGRSAARTSPAEALRDE